MRLATACLLTLGAVWLVVPSTQGQQRFRVGVDVLHIQVSVADESGAFVPDLTEEDFELRIDGERRSIVTAYTVDSDAPPESWLPGADRVEEAATPEPAVRAVETLPGAARRRFLIFLDLERMSRVGLRNTRRALDEFFDLHIRPADLLGLTVYSPIAGLEYIVPFTARQQIVRDAVDSLETGRWAESTDAAGEGIPLDEVIAQFSMGPATGGGGEGGGDAQLGDLVSEMERARLESATDAMLQALNDLAEALTATEGRKHVLMFSHGLPNGVLESPAVTGQLDDFAETARRSDVVFHTFDPSNVGVSNVNDVREIESSWKPGSARAGFAAPSTFVMTDRMVLHYLARETGGEASFWRWAVKKGLEEVERITNDYYLLAFPLRDDDPDVLDIEVRSLRPEVEVTWAPAELRVGGGEDEPPTEFQRQFEVAEALEIGASRDDLGVSVRSWLLPRDGERRRVAIVTQIGEETLQSLREGAEDAALQFELLGLTVSNGRNVLDYFRGVARADLRETADGSVQPFRFASWVRVPPGRHFVKVMLRETGSGRLFSRSLAVVIPDEPESGLRLDSPLLALPPIEAPMIRGVPASEMGDAEAGTREPTIDPFAVNGVPITFDLSDTIEPGSRTVFLATVRGVRAHPDTGNPRVALSATLSADDGTRIPLRPLEVLRSEWNPDTGVLLILVRAPVPSDVDSGVYELELSASDAIAGADATASLTVSVLR